MISNSDRNNDSQPLESDLFDKNVLNNFEYEDSKTGSNINSTEDNELKNINISLLEEKLVVSRQKHKVGEVVVRKQIETKIVKIPIKREKLIIERIGKNPEKLTEVIVNEEKVNGFGYDELKDDSSQLYTISSQYLSIEEAKNLLADISEISTTDSPKICLKVVTKNSELQQKYQDVGDRY